jgi:ABC-type uncharacterized transport system permease subunit
MSTFKIIFSSFYVGLSCNLQSALCVNACLVDVFHGLRLLFLMYEWHLEMIWTGTAVSANKTLSDCANYYQMV